MEENIKLMVMYAEKIIEIANNLKYKQKGLVFTNNCKNCGKEIQVARKNHYFCDQECKKEYTKKIRKEKYQKTKQNMTDLQKEQMKQYAVERMRELRKLRKGEK